MLVIESKSFQSEILTNFLKENTDKYNGKNESVLIDYTQNDALNGLTAHYCTNGFYEDLEDMTAENAIDDYIRWHKSFENYKTIVFHVNAPIGMINEFKNLEGIYNQKIIATFQNDNLENVKIYNI